jgi:hypothetical protein
MPETESSHKHLSCDKLPSPTELLEGKKRKRSESMDMPSVPKKDVDKVAEHAVGA